jgi:hypothetical protein
MKSNTALGTLPPGFVSVSPRGSLETLGHRFNAVTLLLETAPALRVVKGMMILPGGGKQPGRERFSKRENSQARI